jgi:transcriptional regulator with XRE-family HTH domain
MLSLIENGSATPSLVTLKYIADALGVPVAYLLYEEDNLFIFEKTRLLPKIKECFSEQKYTKCMDLIDKLPSSDDELNYMYCVSSFRQAKRLVFRGSLISAGRLLELSKQKAEKTVYDTNAIEAGILLYTSIVQNVQSPLLEFDSEQFELMYKRSSDYEFYKYIIQDASYEYKNELYTKHIEAKFMVRKNNYYEAIKTLCQVEESAKFSDEYNACLLFGVYTDLEGCYKSIGDFENAYRYSSKRISLMEAFKQ